MASIGAIVFGLVVMMSGKVAMARLEPGGTHQFDHAGYTYWAKMNWWGRVNFFDAQGECENLHDGELVKITSDEQYGTIQSEVADKIPYGWRDVKLWTSDSETADTYQVLVIWTSERVIEFGGSNTEENHVTAYRGNGYVCQSRNSNASTENTTEPSLSVTQTIRMNTSTSDDSLTTPDPSTTTLSSMPSTTTSAQPTTATTEGPATTVPLSSTSATPHWTTTTDGRTSPTPKRGSCSEEYIAAMMEYKELLAEYRESFDAWKNSVNL